MEYGSRIDAFPATAGEAVGWAAAFCLGDAPTLVTFSQWADDLIIARQVSGSSACPCHTTNAPWAVAEMERLSIVRFDHPDPLEKWVEGVALCGLHNGLEVAAKLQRKLGHSCVVRSGRWHETDRSDKACCPEGGRPVASYPAPRWTGPVSASGVTP